MTIPDTAIEAAAVAYFVAVQPNSRKPEDWEGVSGVWKKSYRDQSTAALTAAAPFIAAQAKAEALREAALAMDNIAVNTLVTSRSGVSSTWGNAADWLRARAETIEGKSE